MKRVGIVVGAFAALLVGVVAMDAGAQGSGPNKKTRERGMAEAPAAVTKAKIACNVSDAYLINEGTDPATKAKQQYYEVACSGGMGYVIENTEAATRAYDCLTINEQAKAAKNGGGLTCKLDGNKDPKSGLAPLVTATGRTCAVTAARPMGSTAAGDSFFEVACDGGTGYIIKTSAAKTDVMDCVQFMEGDTKCELTTPEQIAAGFTKLVATAGLQCPLSGQRYVGGNDTATFYEVACGPGKGYMIQTSNAGVFEKSIECTKADGIGGGCKLTNVAEAQQAEAATYTQLAKNAGYPCEVSGYRFVGVDEKTKSEVVEMTCSNRKDGGVGIFPTAGGKGQVLDCVVGEAYGVTCKLNQVAAALPKYTEGLKSKGRTTCQVSNAKWLAQTTSGNDLIETACADGDPGYVMVIARATGAVDELLTCGQARNSGAACTFPTNTRNAAAAAKP